MTVGYIQNIGVIGLGRMGKAIANNILKSKFNLIVYNRTIDKTRSLIEAGQLVQLVQKKPPQNQMLY